MPKLEMPRQFWLLIYDLPNEAPYKADKAKWKFLKHMRDKIWTQLVIYQKCRYVQDSVYRLDEKRYTTVVKMVEGWQKEYAQRNFKPNIDIIPFGTTEEGYQTFLEREIEFLLQWCADITKRLTKIQNEGRSEKLPNQTIASYRRRLELIQEIIKDDLEGHERKLELEDNVQIAHDELGKITNAKGMGRPDDGKAKK